MTDLERAADLVARSIPIGFSSPESNDRCCGIIDALAAEILRMDGDPDPEGLTALITRQQDRLEKVAMELSNLRDENFGLKSDLAMERGERLLAEHQAVQSSVDAIEAETEVEELEGATPIDTPTPNAFFTITGKSDSFDLCSLITVVGEEDAETINTALDAGDSVQVSSDGGTTLVHAFRNVGLYVETHAYILGGIRG